MRVNLTGLINIKNKVVGILGVEDYVVEFFCFGCEVAALAPVAVLYEFVWVCFASDFGAGRDLDGFDPFP